MSKEDVIEIEGVVVESLPNAPVSYTHLSATIQGLCSLRDAEQVAATRGKSVKDIIG